MDGPEERNGHASTTNGNAVKAASPASSPANTSNGYQNGNSHPQDDDDEAENGDAIEEMGLFCFFHFALPSFCDSGVPQGNQFA